MARKAQLQMTETILVLIIFFFLLVFGLAFYVKFSSMSEKKQSTESVQLDVIQVAQRIQFMPELQCTRDGTEVIPDCFDLLKLDSFSGLTRQKMPFYSKQFFNTRILVNLVYPYEDEWVVYDNHMNDSKGMESFYLPVTLFNATAQQYYFGYVTVGVYY